MNPYRLTYRDCSQIRARRAAQRRVAIATLTIVTIVVLTVGWMVLR